MARFSTVISALLSAATIHSVLASPSCAYKYRGKAGCVEKCKDSWGWSSGLLGSNPWGPVVVSTTIAVDTYIPQACGSSALVSSQTSTSTTVGGPRSTGSAPTTGAPLTTALPSPSSSRPGATSATSSVSSSQDQPSPVVNAIRPATTQGSSTSPVKPTTTSIRISTPVVQITTTPAATPKPTTTSTKAPAAVPTTTSVQASPTSTGSTSSADIANYLEGHNSIRELHGSADLTWSNDLAAAAQKWANNCQFRHSEGSLGPYGENLAAGTNLGILDAIKMWTDESSQYNPSNPQFSHFTQVVWKGTTQVGCAVQTCNGLLGGTAAAKFYVCEYNPAGNVVGQFAQNVQA